MSKHDPYSEDGRYVSVPQGHTLARPMAPAQPWTRYPAAIGGIETCAGCSQLGTVVQPSAAPGQPTSERPWWFWLAIGGGVGLLAGIVHRSGILANPEVQTQSKLNQQAAAIAVQAGIPTILWGAPGVGKTSWLEALGETMDAEVFTIIGSTKDPADIGGMMTMEGTLIPPIWAAKIRQRSLDGLQSVLFLDEFSSMMPIVHAAMLRVVKDKIAGDCNFDPAIDDHGNPTKYRGHAVHVVCAANPSKQGAQAIDLPPPAANRMLHIDWVQPDILTYGLGLILGWPTPRLQSLPDDWRESKEALSARNDIATFVKNTGQSSLFKYPEGDTADQTGRAWPSPRSWQMATEALGAARACGASDDVQDILISGCVGAEISSLLKVFLTERNLPNPEDILNDPTSWVPEEGRTDLLWRVLGSVVSAVEGKPTLKRWNAAWFFIGHLIRHDDTLQHLIKPWIGDLTDIAKDKKDASGRVIRPVPEELVPLPGMPFLTPPKSEFKLIYPLLKEAGIVKADPIKSDREKSKVSVRLKVKTP
jgi:MoxR-like ATPase